MDYVICLFNLLVMIKKHVVLAVGFVFLLFSVKAQTTVSGTLPGNTVWTKANSPYQITANVTLNAGDTLTIEPGTHIEFSHYTRQLIINGTLMCVGLSNDSIVFDGTLAPGRVVLGSSGSGSVFRYTHFYKLGVFNNPAIDIAAQQVVVDRCSFQNCETGMVVKNNTDPFIDSCTIEYCNDFAIQVLSGHPTIQNSILNNCYGSGLYLQDSAYVVNNSITNNGGIAGAGIHIDALVYPYIDNNTFSTNHFDLLTHPATLNDTLYDNNGLSIIHVDNKTIGQNTTWHLPVAPESWYYALTGDVTVASGDTLTLEPGIEMRFLHYTYDLRIQGTLISQGTLADTILITGNPIAGRVELLSGSQGSIVQYTHFQRLGAFNNPALAVHSSSVTIDHNTFSSCEVGMTFYNGASPVVEFCDIISSADWGIRVENGNPTIRNNTIDLSSTAGVYLLDSARIYNNTISGVSTGANRAGIIIENVVYPYIHNNVFSSNGADILTHPAVVNDTLFDNNGISVIHIDNKTIGQTTTWHEPVLPEDWYYVLTGVITVNAGDSLTIQAGVEMEFTSYTSDLAINGSLFANGSVNDSIRFSGSPIGGRILINSAADTASFDYVRFDQLGAFNNPGLGVYNSATNVQRSYFNTCEVGITVYNEAQPNIDSCFFINSHDYGVRVLSGNPQVTNSTFDNNRFGAIYLTDTAWVVNNLFTNTNFPNYSALHIDAPVVPFIHNNTFTNNVQDVLTHPAIVNDTVFDNNGLSIIHIDNKSIGQSTLWHAPQPPENWYYASVGDVTVNAGDTLEVEAGVRYEFRHYTHDLLVNGVMLGVGNAADSIAFRAPSSGGRIVLNGGGSTSEFHFTKFENLGVSNLPALDVSSDSVVVHRSTFNNCEVGILLKGGASAAVDSCLFEASTDYALQVTSGNAVVSKSCFESNSFGITVSAPSSVTAVSNWWGDPSGPLHATNAAGLGDEVSNFVTFTPWLTKSPCIPDPPPVVDTVFPTDNSINVAIGVQPYVVFDQLIQKGNAARVKLLRLSDSTAVYDEDISHASLTVSSDSLFISTSLLPVNTALFVTIDSNAIQNLNATAYPGMVLNSTWNFTTEDDADNDGFTPSQGDCNDADSTEFPGQVWYADNDNDGFGDVNNSLIQCAQPPGYLLDTTDCNDNDSLQFPGQTWYADTDSDGFGDVNNTLVQCAQPVGYVLDSTDCNDANALEFPGQVWYADNDNDTFGNPLDTLIRCLQPLGYLLDSTDCDDNDANEFPGQVWYADLDMDGFGDSLNTLISCEQPLGYLLENTDCDDTDSTAYPGAEEVADGKDNDCDGDIDEDLGIGLSEQQKTSSLKIWPNPAQNRLYIELVKTGQSATVYIRDYSGRVLYTYEYKEAASGVIELEVNDLKPGMYFVDVNVGSNRQLRRFVKK
jgi:parallel beta-helix repeat protein